MTEQRKAYDFPRNGATTGPSRSEAPSASDQAAQFAQKAEEVAGKVAEYAREYGEKAQDAARNFKPFVEKSMKEQPMATLAVGAAIAFVLGALWKK